MPQVFKYSHKMAIKARTNTTHKKLKSRKRQWGTERQTTPLSTIHEQPSSSKIALSRLSVVFTIVFWAMYVISVVIRQLIEGPKSYQFTLEVYGYLVVVTFLTLSALIYLITRQGALQRFSKHIRVPRALLDKHFSTQQESTITVLIPSYSEEPEVIRKTMLSAALQEYPNIRVVLLIDDNPIQTTSENINRLNTTRQIATDIQALLGEPHANFVKALKNFEFEVAHEKVVPIKCILDISRNYMQAGEWLNNLAKREVIEDHVDVFFAENVILDLANDLTLVGHALLSSYNEGATLTKERVLQLYRRLTWIFGVEMAYFERKKYVSLSNELNKAMNLNSYIGLMGGSYIEEKTDEGLILEPCTDNSPNCINIPDSEFLLTLDADSILLKDYCLRLVYFLQQPDNQDVAITQTPYSSFRGAPTRIERLSGATTDVQHILHQGMSYYNATFWVGANAVIRKKALDDIVEKEWVGGYEIKRYVQDRTVIEDTESSIDLAMHGWRLVNYPERLSYSATPPDFGSLVVQRRRWANGGLLILPKLLSQVRERKLKGENVSNAEFMIRINYMASIAWSNLGLLFLLAYPYDGRLLSPFVLLAALPYFIAMASDLKYCRYSYLDILSIYGFNLMLLPVNIAGVLKSLQQALTTKKIPFARTPKIKNRTAVAIPFVISPLLIVAFSVFTMWRNIQGHNWGNAAFAGFNAFATTWAILAYIGLLDLLTDLWYGIKEMMYVEVKDKSQKNKVSEPQPFDWKAILYSGETSGTVPRNGMKDVVLNNKD